MAALAFSAAGPAKPGQEDELGIFYDQLSKKDSPAHDNTVYLANLLLLPPTEPEFLALPKEVFHSTEEVYEAGWRS